MKYFTLSRLENEMKVVNEFVIRWLIGFGLFALFRIHFDCVEIQLERRFWDRLDRLSFVFIVIFRWDLLRLFYFFIRDSSF